MTSPNLLKTAMLVWLMAGLSGPVLAQDAFTVTSPAFAEGGLLPDDLKCTRDGGDGISPPLAWANPPAGTVGYAIVMQHYPRDTVEGRDTPNHYWLLWDIPAATTGLERGNPASVGDEGANKDQVGTGYSPPCAPPGPGTHTYTIIVYALSKPLEGLPAHDDVAVDWKRLVTALDGATLATAKLDFKN